MGNSPARLSFNAPTVCHLPAIGEALQSQFVPLKGVVKHYTDVWFG